MWRRTDLASYRSGSPQWETVLSVDALNRAEGESWVYKGHTVYRPRDGSPPTRTLLELSRGGADAVVLRCADTHVSRGPSVLYVLYLLYGPRVPASRVLYAPASGVPYAPRTLAPQVLREFDIVHKRFVPPSEGGFVVPEAKTRANPNPSPSPSPRPSPSPSPSPNPYPYPNPNPNQVCNQDPGAGFGAAACNQAGHAVPYPNSNSNPHP